MKTITDLMHTNTAAGLTCTAARTAHAILSRMASLMRDGYSVKTRGAVRSAADITLTLLIKGTGTPSIGTASRILSKHLGIYQYAGSDVIRNRLQIVIPMLEEMMRDEDKPNGGSEQPCTSGGFVAEAQVRAAILTVNQAQNAMRVLECVSRRLDEGYVFPPRSVKRGVQYLTIDMIADSARISNHRMVYLRIVRRHLGDTRDAETDVIKARLCVELQSLHDRVASGAPPCRTVKYTPPASPETVRKILTCVHDLLSEGYRFAQRGQRKRGSLPPILAETCARMQITRSITRRVFRKALGKDYALLDVTAAKSIITECLERGTSEHNRTSTHSEVGQNMNTSNKTTKPKGVAATRKAKTTARNPEAAQSSAPAVMFSGHVPVYESQGAETEAAPVEIIHDRGVRRKQASSASKVLAFPETVTRPKKQAPVTNDDVLAAFNTYVHTIAQAIANRACDMLLEAAHSGSLKPLILTEAAGMFDGAIDRLKDGTDPLGGAVTAIMRERGFVVVDLVACAAVQK